MQYDVQGVCKRDHTLEAQSAKFEMLEQKRESKMGVKRRRMLCHWSGKKCMYGTESEEEPELFFSQVNKNDVVVSSRKHRC